MSNRLVRRSVLSLAAVAAAVAAAITATPRPAAATTGIRNAFQAKYPTSTLLTRTAAATGSACYACHQPPSNSTQGNCYRAAIAARLAAGRTNAQAIDDVDGLDSDGDGVPNGVEILMARTDLPGQIGYNPGLIGDKGTDPCGPSTTTPVTNQSETPPAVCAADFNGDGFVTGDDFDLYVAAFELGDISADFNADGFVTGDDFDAFVTAFEAGC